MQCEMCGIPIKGRPIVVKIEGAIMEVCNNCSKFGEKIVPKTKPIKPKFITFTKIQGDNQ